MARIFAVLALILLVLVVAGLLLAPRIVDSQAERILSAGPFDATVGDVEIDPLQGQVRLLDVRVVDEESGAVVAEVPLAEMEASLGALLKGKLVVKQATLHRASFDLAATPARTEAWLEELRDELVRLPAVTVLQLSVLDSNARIHSATLERAIPLEPMEVKATHLRNRPAPEGELPTTAWITATLPPGGMVRAELKASLFAPQSDFDLVIRGNDLPVAKASEKVKEKTGLRAEGGRANVALDARLRDGSWNGTIATRVEEIDLGGDSLAEKFFAGLAEAGADVATEAGVAKRVTEFDGKLKQKDATLELALLAVLDDAIAELADVPG